MSAAQLSARRLKYQTPWIHSGFQDLLYIFFPLLLPALWVLLHPGLPSELSSWHWLILVLGTDVAHVWSTLAVTYLKPNEFLNRRILYTLVPLGCFAGAFSLHHLGGSGSFWRVLAYFAVFHFVRQQYGFLKIYSRQETLPFLLRWMAALTLYASMLVPLLLWHFQPERPFHWFVPGDFIDLSATLAGASFSSATIEHLKSDLQLGAPFFLLFALGAYLFLEILHAFKVRKINWGRPLLLLGTALSWWVGIEVAKGDLPFTAINVLAHGIPYLAIVVWNREKTSPFYRWRSNSSQMSSQGGPHTESAPSLSHHAGGFPLGIVLFFFLIFLLSYVEEGFWTGLIWREHLELFPFFRALSELSTPVWTSFWVALLSVPQLSHYIFDGVIWKGGKSWKASPPLKGEALQAEVGNPKWATYLSR
jgi:hypothetical protein